MAIPIQRKMKNKTNFPPGWDEERVQRILRHYDSLTEEEAVTEDEAGLRCFSDHQSRRTPY